MENKTTVIFDLDGTLLDTLDDLTASVNYALAAMGYPKRSRDEVCSFVGNGVKKLICRAVPENTGENNIEKTFGIFSRHYSEHMNDTTHPYDGVVTVLEKLKRLGAKIGVFSNKYDAAVKILCKDFFGDSVDVAIGESDKVAKKPAPDGVFAVLKELGEDLGNAVYMGDADTDFFTAKNAGVDFVGVSWGFRPRSLLEDLGAKTVADKPQELFEILKEALRK